MSKAPIHSHSRKDSFFPSQAVVMGILNATPDSFYDGGRFNLASLVERGLCMVAQGATILDVGGESTRPEALSVSPEEQLNRVLPLIKELRKQSTVAISIDTTSAQVAKAALDAGADGVNDVSAASDPHMLPLVVQTKSPIIVMHMKGTPRTMQQNPHYDNVVAEVLDFLKKRTQLFVEAGHPKELILWDPGIGFGKTLEHNLCLLRSIKNFFHPDHALVLGVSRKSFIQKISPQTAERAEKRLAGSLAALYPALEWPKLIIRTHDAGDTRQFLDVTQRLCPTYKENLP